MSSMDDGSRIIQSCILGVGEEAAREKRLIGMKEERVKQWHMPTSSGNTPSHRQTTCPSSSTTTSPSPFPATPSFSTSIPPPTTAAPPSRSSSKPAPPSTASPSAPPSTRRPQSRLLCRRHGRNRGGQHVRGARRPRPFPPRVRRNASQECGHLERHGRRVREERGDGRRWAVFEAMPEPTPVAWAEMVDGFGKVRDTASARRWFDRVPVGMRNVVTWSVMVGGYARNGEMEAARAVFDDMLVRNEACWNSMISGFASFGESEEAIKLLCRMEASGSKPTEITFIAVLSACAHGGLVEDGFKIFERMENVYGVAAGIEHYGCMVDLLGRVGRLEEAFDLVKKMPMEPNEVVWDLCLELAEST